MISRKSLTWKDYMIHLLVKKEITKQHTYSNPVYVFLSVHVYVGKYIWKDILQNVNSYLCVMGLQTIFTFLFILFLLKKRAKLFLYSSQKRKPLSLKRIKGTHEIKFCVYCSTLVFR